MSKLANNEFHATGLQQLIFTSIKNSKNTYLVGEKVILLLKQIKLPNINFRYGH